MSDTPTILDLARAKHALNLEDADEARDTFIRDTILPGIDEIVEQYVGWVVKRDRTFTIGARRYGQEVVLPGTRVIAVKSAATLEGDLDVTGMTVTDAGIVRAAPGNHLPSGSWTITVETGFDPIPQALVMAATELLTTAWENYQAGPAGDARPFLVSYRAEAWLTPFTNGATIA